MSNRIELERTARSAVGDHMDSERESTILSRTLANTETLQIANIHSLDAFFTPIEERFERITRLGRQALRVPVIAITSVTDETQWFKSVLGWSVGDLPLQNSLCTYTVSGRETVVVPDLTKDPKYANHPLVTGPPKFRFYAGVPLVNAKGTVIGTLCAMGVKPVPFGAVHRQLLDDLAMLAQRELLTIELHSAQTALVSKLSVARRQALLDPLTKTWNRRGGTMLIEECLERASNESKSLALCAVDLNDFKNINDTYGHATGDRALQMVAKELLACVRDNDGVCRFGGDEFFVIIVGAERNDVDKIAGRVANRIRRNTISVGNGKSASVSVAIGIQYVEAGQSYKADELLADADKALYDNKMQHQLRVS